MKQSRRNFLKTGAATIMGFAAGFGTREVLPFYQKKIDDLFDFLESRKKNTSESSADNSSTNEEELETEPIEESSENEIYKQREKLWNRLRLQLVQEKPSPESEIPPRYNRVNNFEYKRPDSGFVYQEAVAEPEIDKVDLFAPKGKYGVESYEGKIVQGLRFQMLTQAAERKYNLPPNLLLAMLIHESGAEEFLPNAKGDGGFGLIHMQSGTAKEFGLRVFKNCEAIVCDGSDNRSCKDEHGNKLNHARELQNIVEMHIDDREHLSRTDFRLNHLANIDAAGRILAFHIGRFPDSRKGFSEELKNLGPLASAICRYSGHVNYPEYIKKIGKIMRDVSDQDFISELADKFDSTNVQNDINGKRLGILNYLKEWQIFFLNYGLKDYVSGRCYKDDRYSDTILKTYPRLLGSDSKAV
jgi:hypothetical protein